MKKISVLDQLGKIDKIIDKSLPEDKQRMELCRILLEEISNLTPADLSDYLEFYGIDFIVPGIEIKLKFPIRAHIFNAECADIESRS